MPEKEITVVNINLTGRKERYDLLVGDRPLRFINGSCEPIGLSEDELKRAKELVDEYRTAMPGLMNDTLNLLKERGTPAKAVNGFHYQDGAYHADADDYNADGRTDRIKIQAPGLLITIQASTKVYCGKFVNSEDSDCGCKARAAFSGWNNIVLGNQFSDDAGTHYCVSKKMTSAVFGCHTDDRVEVEKIDRSRRGVREYLKLFDELFED